MPLTSTETHVPRVRVPTGGVRATARPLYIRPHQEGLGNPFLRGHAAIGLRWIWIGLAGDVVAAATVAGVTVVDVPDVNPYAAITVAPEARG